MNINEFFDKIYCINLDRRTDRWDENCLPQFTKFNLNVERISAVDGKTLDLPHDDIYRGELAGSMSHLDALKKAKSENVDKLLLLEDDVVFKDDVDSLFSQYITNVPYDWDILFFGGNHVRGWSNVSPNIMRLHGSYAIHACGIRNKAFDPMIDFLDKSINHVMENKNTKFTPSVAADYFLALLHQNLNVYCFHPHIAWQLEDFSDIQQQKVNYYFLKG